MQNRETRDFALSRRTCIIRDAAAFGIISAHAQLRIEYEGAIYHLLNPARAALIATDKPLHSYQWCSILQPVLSQGRAWNLRDARKLSVCAARAKARSR